MNALLDESRTQRVDIGLERLKQIRIPPTVFDVLSEEKPSMLGWGVFAMLSMIHFVISQRVSHGDLLGAKCLLRRLHSDEPDSSQEKARR